MSSKSSGLAELVEEFIRAFQNEINLQRRENDAHHEAKKRELAEVMRNATARFVR